MDSMFRTKSGQYLIRNYIPSLGNSYFSASVAQFVMSTNKRPIHQEVTESIWSFDLYNWSYLAIYALILLDCHRPLYLFIGTACRGRVKLILYFSIYRIQRNVPTPLILIFLLVSDEVHRAGIIVLISPAALADYLRSQCCRQGMAWREMSQDLLSPNPLTSFSQAIQMPSSHHFSL